MINTVGEEGVPPTVADIIMGRRSVATSGIDYIVITNQQPHRAAVALTVQQLTGCHLETISDVMLCQLATP